MNNNYLSKNNDQPKKSEVVIVGGGIVGAACFYYLTQQGIQVTLIEKNGLSMGTSRGGQGGVGYELEANDWEMLWYRRRYKISNWNGRCGTRGCVHD